MQLRMLVGSMIVAGISLLAGAGLFSRSSVNGDPAQPPASAQSPASPGAAEQFELDPVHSSCVFKIRHMGVANFYGRFNAVSGTYTLDGANSRFELLVQAESVDTRVKKRDDHLRSPDFFNAAEYPTIAFKSTSVKTSGENKLSVTGDLTLHGVTRPVTAEVAIFPAKSTPQGYKSGFDTRFTIKRTDFKMDTYVANGGLGDEVEITFAGEGAKP